MQYLKTFTACLAALALHNADWAKIYESEDAQGNPVYTDSPVGTSSDVVDLPATNSMEAPPPDAGQEQPAVEQESEEGNAPVFVDDAVVGGEASYDEMMRKEREYDRENPDAPHEVLDAEQRHEVGDFGQEMTD